jgi:tetratricopeptide (TPR) repeat protein
MSIEYKLSAQVRLIRSRPLAHPSHFVYVAPRARAPFPPGTFVRLQRTDDIRRLGVMTRRGSQKHKTRTVAASPLLTRENLFWGLLLIVVTIVAYRHAWSAGYIWDDDVYVTENQLLTAPDGLRRIWFSLDSPSQYFPLVYTTFRLEHAVWGLNPAGYHWVNILLHAANAFLLWRLLVILRIPGAWLAAAIFALHPVHVESVAWITERKNVLMGFFSLLSLISWARFVDDKSKNGNSFGLALLFYALALFSKTTACTLPAAMLLILWLKEKPITGRRVLQIVPFVVLGICLGLVTVWWERYHQGTQGQLFAIGMPERFLVAGRALWFYAGKLLWPVDLVFSYPRWNISSSNVLDYFWLLATLLLGVAIYFLRRPVGRGLEVAMLFFVATLSPMVGFIMLYTFRYSFVADHYQYLASIGPIALAAAGITTASDRLAKGAAFLKPALGGTLLVALGLLTWNQCKMYVDSDALWWTTIARNPQSWMAHNNIAINLLKKGQTDEAIVHYNKALELDPNYGEAHYNLANALLRQGRMNDAVAHFEKALELNPNNLSAHYNLGSVLVQSGRVDEGIAHFRKAVELNPKNAAAHNNLGAALLRAGRVDEAATQYRDALVLDPNNAQTNYNLANTLAQYGRLDEAVKHYQKALQLNPRDAAAHDRLSKVLRQLGRGDEANAHAQKARDLGSSR